MKFFIIFSVLSLISVSNGQTRIAGGNAVDISVYPFSTSLLSNLGATGFRQLCGGTIISQNAILSAGFCFVTNNVIHSVLSWRARVGSTYSNTLGMVYLIRNISLHPDFNANTRDNDLAVLRTSLNLPFGPTIQSAYLAGRFYRLANNDQVWAIGWGVTSPTSLSSSELRHVQIWVNDQRICAERYAALNFNVTENMLCAGWLDVGIRGQCLGDTGSPLVHNNVVIGVYSWTEGCGSSIYPNINTRVPNYTQWIVDTAVAAI